MEVFNSLINLDIELFWLLNQAHSPIFDLFFAISTNLGHALFLIPALWLLLVINPPVKSKKHAVIFLLSSLAICGIINSSIKSAVKRPRPVLYFSRQTEGETPTTNQVHVVGPAHKYRSFPSGHTNTAFAAATALILLYGAGAWFAYLGALCVAYSRVYLGVHFPFDTLVGAILAVITTILLYRIYNRWIHSFERRQIGIVSTNREVKTLKA